MGRPFLYIVGALVYLNVGVGTYNGHRKKMMARWDSRPRTNLPCFYSAFIQASEPVSLTDTSERKMCRGLPSAVPRCSVETSRGPAFL